MTLRFRHILRSVFSNWFAMAATLAVGFFLSPFVVHRLGNVAYGVWVLAISSINYMGLLDLGMASSVVRFVSKGYSTQNHQESSDALSAVLWVRAQIGAIIVVLTGALSFLFPILFKVPPQLSSDARIAVLIIGISSAIGMCFGVFSSTLSALNRYDLKSYISLLQLAIRSLGVVAVLLAGKGIIAIAVCEFVAALAGAVLLMYASRRIYPELALRISKPSRDVLGKVWSYSAYAFVQTIAIQLVYQSDNLVVGAFISATAVTLYSIGNQLCRYTQQLVSAMTVTFAPAASTFEASGDIAKLKTLYTNGTRATLAISLPIVSTLILRGGTFIGLWMGAQYSRPSGIVVAILAFALLFSLQNTPAGAIAYGIEKHQAQAKYAMAEAVANLALSIILARKLGIYGVAIGTLVPNLLINLIFWPMYVRRLTGIRAIEVVWDVWRPMYLTAVPFAAATYAVDIYFPAKNIATFIFQTLALLSLFVATVALLFRSSIQQEVFPRIRSMFPSGAR